MCRLLHSVCRGKGHAGDLHRQPEPVERCAGAVGAGEHSAEGCTPSVVRPWGTTLQPAACRRSSLCGCGCLQVAEVFLKTTGECGETCRDLYHSQYGLGGLIQLAELAWHQGVDLYSWGNNRLARCMVRRTSLLSGRQHVLYSWMACLPTPNLSSE